MGQSTRTSTTCGGEIPSAVISDTQARCNANTVPGSLPPSPKSNSTTHQTYERRLSPSRPAPRATTQLTDSLPEPHGVLSPSRARRPRPCCRGHPPGKARAGRRCVWRHSPLPSEHLSREREAEAGTPACPGREETGPILPRLAISRLLKPSRAQHGTACWDLCSATVGVSSSLFFGLNYVAYPILTILVIYPGVQEKCKQNRP